MKIVFCLLICSFVVCDSHFLSTEFGNQNTMIDLCPDGEHYIPVELSLYNELADHYSLFNGFYWTDAKVGKKNRGKFQFRHGKGKNVKNSKGRFMRSRGKKGKKSYLK